MSLLAEVYSDEANSWFVVPIVLYIFFLIALAIKVHHSVVVTPIINELLALHERRIERVRQALASTTSTDWEAPAPSTPLPFAGRVHLLRDGKIAVGGETFDANDSFTAVAKDDRNIPHAKVGCAGGGIVRIESHGQVFRAEFHNGEWNIQLLASS
jgi:hypothetical protein